MDKIDIGFVSHVNHKLKKPPLNPRYCLGRFKVGNEDFRQMPSYTDPRNYPAYYYIACHIQPKTVLEIGFKTGLESGCLLAGCGRTVEHFFGFHQKTSDYWSSRISRSNISNMLGKKIDHWNGSINDAGFLKKFLSRRWDCVIINEQSNHRGYLELAWSRLDPNGLILMDHTSNDEARKALATYCEIVKRKPALVRSRNGIAIISK